MQISIIPGKLHRKRFFRRAVCVFIWICIWQLVSFILDQQLLIPQPLNVFKAFGTLISERSFWVLSTLTISRILIGFFLALFVGVILAILTSASSLAYDFFYPAISIIKATPVASFIILALFWFSTGNVPIFIAFLMVLPVIWANVLQGIRNTDPKLIEMGKIFRFSRIKVYIHIYIPSIMPYFKAAFTTGLGLAWKAGVAAEVIGRPALSIGNKLAEAKIYLESEMLFAWTIVVVIISILLENVLVGIVNLLNDRYGRL